MREQGHRFPSRCQPSPLSMILRPDRHLPAQLPHLPEKRTSPPPCPPVFLDSTPPTQPHISFHSVPSHSTLSHNSISLGPLPLSPMSAPILSLCPFPLFPNLLLLGPLPPAPFTSSTAPLHPHHSSSPAGPIHSIPSASTLSHSALPPPLSTGFLFPFHALPYPPPGISCQSTCA